MKRYFFPLFIVFICAAAGIYFFLRSESPSKSKFKNSTADIDEDEDEEQEDTLRALYIKEREKYDFDLLKDPATGKIPYRITEKEMELARNLPSKIKLTGSGIQEVENLNVYKLAGPNNIGGRTRALAYDKRFNNTTNKVILSGPVSGGIFRSSDGGNSWTRVSPQDDIHNVTSIAQDPRPGSQDTWYAGGGETIANSADAPGSPYLSNGIWKSVNNGVSWQKLTQDIPGITTTPTLESFDHPFDFVHKIIVNPANGDVYIVGHRRLVRSVDGGLNWAIVFEGPSAASSDNGQMDIASTNAGILYLAVNGGFPDAVKRGVFTSTNGTAWTRIAGGTVLNTDSVAGWRGNDPGINSRRIILTLAPSSPNQSMLYVCYENGLSQASSPDPKPEVDMFKLDVSSGSRVWTNLSANMPDFPGQMDGVDPIDTQEGYNMTLLVKPDDPNTVFLGATSLFRSTSGFSNTSSTEWIGGYNKSFGSGLQIYPNSHPDFHNLAIMPNNGGSNPGFLKAIAADDGGLQLTDNIMSATPPENPVAWVMAGGYQTLQYYDVAIDPTPGVLDFVGGAQDNGTYFRTNSNADSNKQTKIIGGDGGSVGILPIDINNNSKFVFCSSQLGSLYRKNSATLNLDQVEPSGLTPFPGLSGAFGEFVTLFRIDFDNPEDLYYVNFNRLFRTTSASTVASDGWTELTGVRSAVNPANPSSGTDIAIRSVELSKGPYAPSHALYIGTSDSKVYRLDNPRNTLANTAPVDISPPGLTGSVSDIAVNPNNDEEILIVISNYSTTSIWWTNNAKSSIPTWKNAEGNLELPSIRSCKIVVKKDLSGTPVTEYYVGTSVGLYSAVNIGPLLQSNAPLTWEREGGDILNFALVNSLDYRPQDNILLVGTHGNGMYFASVGTADFRPNQNTGVDDPVRNDKNFIQQAYPTIAKTTIDYRIGNMFTINKIVIRIINMSGQTVMRKETNYSSGQVNVYPLPGGVYILSITSKDNKQQFVQKFVKK